MLYIIHANSLLQSGNNVFSLHRLENKSINIINNKI